MKTISEVDQETVGLVENYFEAMAELTEHIQRTFCAEHPEHYKMIEGAFEAGQLDLVWFSSLLNLNCKLMAIPKGDFPDMKIFEIQVPKNMTLPDSSTGQIDSIH